MKSRIGAGSYLLVMSSSVIAWSLATLFASEQLARKGHIGLTELNALVSLLGVGVGIVFYRYSAGRLRDLNFSGWWVNALAFPFFGVIVLPVLCFLSGPRWTNDYGPPPPPSGWLKVAAALVLFAVALGASRLGLVAYYGARHALLS